MHEEKSLQEMFSVVTLYANLIGGNFVLQEIFGNVCRHLWWSHLGVCVCVHMRVCVYPLVWLCQPLLSLKAKDEFSIFFQNTGSARSLFSHWDGLVGWLRGQ